MIRCVIIEDQPPAQRILQKYIADMGNLDLQGVFSDGIQAMDFLESNAIDLIFLDIHLPKLSGIDFMKVMENRPDIILTTAFPDYALESYEYHVVDYLLKPFSFERFVKAVSKVSSKNKEVLNAESPETEAGRKEIFIKSGYEHIKILIEDILYIRSDADYTEIITPLKKHLSSEPLRYWLENLPGRHFVRSHKSFIVNSSKIEKVTGNLILLPGDIKVPIGRAYKEEFMKRILN
ncbi:LytR/AlgR family response regulator transcription factor [Poritiphilus flavus]|uniref:Response regulator n=1 Tax=Poritiphilus flavus TaxID=2697053 RepID=A0A6L9E790_9FLAO|nr:LytTR family DNA-binding domain-containing protein [Poritiphilus flavus]NAS10587.1 response regulator [Poritiphilus flavus]